MIKPPFTIEDYARIEAAKVFVKGIRNRVDKRFQPEAISLSVYILALLNQAMDYIRHNIGENVPTACTLLFCHSFETLRNLEKAKGKLKEMMAYLHPDQRAEMKQAYTRVNELLKDLQAHIKHMQKVNG